MTVVWGVVVLGEGSLRAELAFLISRAALLAISSLLAAAVIGPVASWTLDQRRDANTEKDAGR